jgi:alkanesulfonate monooxygenase SsuD/methylene tetrahydromethanopterin reductase-like flavin-dependent oxidoreductase (luciferase family)
MEVGIGLPNAVAGTTGKQLVEWAKRADEAGFSSLGTIDRIVYPNFEPFVALSAAAAVTERIRLTTSILIVPFRQSAAVVAKQAMSLNELSGGRLVLGVAVGPREDDYELAGVPFDERGRLMDEMLPRIKEVWANEDVGPNGAPRLVVGGQVGASFRRAAEHGDGWIMGGGTPDQLKEGKAKLQAAWKEAGREGEPRVMALAYYGLGPRGKEYAESDLKHYYAWLGDDIASAIAASAATDADTVKAYLAAFDEAGCDELIMFPAAADPEQVDLLAEVALAEKTAA